MSKPINRTLPHKPERWISTMPRAKALNMRLAIMALSSKTLTENAAQRILEVQFARRAVLVFFNDIGRPLTSDEVARERLAIKLDQAVKDRTCFLGIEIIPVSPRGSLRFPSLDKKSLAEISEALRRGKLVIVTLNGGEAIYAETLTWLLGKKLQAENLSQWQIQELLL